MWVKKNHNTRGERLKIATYNVRTLLKYEHVQELEEELKENNMKWDVIGLREVRRKEESFTTLQSGHMLLALNRDCLSLMAHSKSRLKRDMVTITK